MTLLYHGDCNELMSEIADDSVDLIFCDLPYGQTNCKWDCKIDLERFWGEVMRVKKLHTPIFFTTTTKFGVELIMSAPKKCHFRYDIVWVKSAPAGFLSAKKMPMRKHEMIYVFYERLPFYDLSSHTHKFIKEPEEKYVTHKLYGNGGKDTQKKGEGKKKVLYKESKYEPPLPVSVVKVELCNYDVNKNTYGGGKEGRIKIPKDKKYHEAKYEPPLPVSVVKEEGMRKDPHTTAYGDNIHFHQQGQKNGESIYDPPLPVSVVKEEKYERKNSIYPNRSKNGETSKSYDPPLPNSILEVNSQRGKHATQKPTELMKWVLKYYSKEGDVVLDPTMGSGSTGVACKEMNRNFIGIEMDSEIFEVAKGRIG